MTTITIIVADWFLWWVAGAICVTAGLAIYREYLRKPRAESGGGTGPH